jgi:AAA+ ATPase superfamily predicted ATPase
MKSIEFYNREKEIKEIRDILNAQPTLITFIYGPINSGKTELISHVIEELPKEYVVFYINLRGKFISSYKDFVRALFKLEREKKDYKAILKTLSEVSLKTVKFSGIPITEAVLDLFFRENTYEDVFEFLENYFMELAVNKVPVLIVDELHKIGDVKIDTYLIYELFNLFIRLTKELHLCHIFAVTSDSLFIERVYNEALLQGRCRYLFVDDFDYETTTAFLESHGFTGDEKAMAWEYCSGKPVNLLELILAEDKKRSAKEMLTIRVSQLRDLLDYLNYTRPRMMIGADEYAVEKEDLVNILSKFADAEYIEDEGLNRPAKYFLIKDNILFMNPTRGIIKPQSRLDLLAIRELIKRSGQKEKPE